MYKNPKNIPLSMMTYKVLMKLYFTPNGVLKKDLIKVCKIKNRSLELFLSRLQDIQLLALFKNRYFLIRSVKATSFVLTAFHNFHLMQLRKKVKKQKINAVSRIKAIDEFRELVFSARQNNL